MEALESLFSFRIRVGRVAGVDVYVHWTLLIPVLYFLYVWRDSPRLAFLALMVLWGSVFLHELGHCFAARAVGGDAREVILWPLGGLAMIHAPLSPWPQFVATAGGPLVNVVLALGAGAALYACGGGWDWRAFWPVGGPELLRLIVGMNAFQALFNVIPAFPMDGGRLLQAALWPKLGFHRAMHVAIVAALVCGGLMGAVALYRQETLLLMIAVGVVLYSLQEREKLRYGVYDAELVQPWQGAPEDERPPRVGFFAAWLERRRQRKVEAAARRREDMRARLDEVLAKVSAQGLDGLTREERRFLEEASSQLRKENPGPGEE